MEVGDLYAGSSFWLTLCAGSSDGIQVGSVRSAYGVLGAWTTTAHDIGDPVGKSNFGPAVCSRPHTPIISKDRSC